MDTAACYSAIGAIRRSHEVRCINRIQEKLKESLIIDSNDCANFVVYKWKRKRTLYMSTETMNAKFSILHFREGKVQTPTRFWVWFGFKMPRSGKVHSQC